MQRRPYKFLDHYESTDKAIFFGREQDAELLKGRIISLRQVLIYGASGNGKTSLLLAGVTPLLQHQFEIIYIRFFDQLEQAVRQEVQKRLPAKPPITTAVALPENNDEPDWPEISRKMALAFDENELRDLTLKLGINDGVIHGENVPAKVQNLIGYMERRGSQKELYNKLLEERPKIFQKHKPAVVETAVATNTQPESLSQFLVQASADIEKPLLFIFDQFDEIFKRTDPDERKNFISEIGTIMQTTLYEDVPIKFVFCLREEMITYTSELEAFFPIRNRFSLAPLTRAQAQDAIVKPLEANIHFEPELIETLLDDLIVPNSALPNSEGHIMPVHLQLVCNALYEKTRLKNQSQITLADYEQAGKVQGILGDYLEDSLRPLPPNEQKIAWQILESVVRSEGTRHKVSLATLLEKSNASTEIINNVLQRLIQSHLIRQIDENQTAKYELMHDFLVPKVTMQPEMQARKAIEEMVEQDLQNWRNYQAFISPDRLQKIESFQGQLLLSSEAKTLILKSKQKQVEAEEMQLQLIQSEKLNFVSRLASGIANKISSPITSFVTNSQFLRDYAATVQDTTIDDLTAEELLNDIIDISHDIENTAKEMHELIRALSNFAKSDQQKVKLVDLHKPLNAALLLLNHDTKSHHIRIQRQFTKHSLMVEEIPGQLVHLFMNIWMNYLEAIEENRVEPIKNGVKIKSSRDQVWCIVEFNFHANIAFHSNATSGHDIKIAEKIARNHAGSIEFIEDSEIGTSFILRLPLMDIDEGNND